MPSELCTFGPKAERKRRWILKFEDADVGDMHFNDQAEAEGAFVKFSDSYTCTVNMDLTNPNHAI